jgi:3-hydroxyisobutyrate dehydrogenase-like beta-hydroxyacid dehydrogenase
MLPERPTVGFFGLGAMGYALAGRLARAGFPVAVADPDSERVDAWTRQFGEVAIHPVEAEFVVTCVTDEATVRSLALGATALVAHMRRGALLIDHTTTSPAFAAELAAAAAAHEVGFVDAPTSGGTEGAAAGTLSVMLGGEDDDVARARTVVNTYASRVVHFGRAGAGQLAKMANQVAIAGVVRGLAEAALLARAGRLDLAQLFDALAAGTANSVQLARTRAELAAQDFDFARTYGWLAKDLDLALAEAGRLGVPLDMAARVASLLERPAS